MKFKDLSHKWKAWLSILSIVNLLLIMGFIGFHSYLASYRASNAAIRAAAQKADVDLIGQRFLVPRDGEDDVKVNLYYPDAYEGALPVLVNFHGGGFVLGDADEMDTQCAKYANDWNMMVISVNYTAPDVKSIYYGIQEGVDTVQFFREHASEYSIDPNRIYVIGHSAGGYYAAMTAIELDKMGIALSGQILMCPWTTGLPDTVSESVAPALFILGGADEISQRSSGYQDTLKTCGVAITVKEYPGGTHTFVHSPYPELASSLSDEERAVNITPEQQALAYQAETDIGQWLNP